MIFAAQPGQQCATCAQPMQMVYMTVTHKVKTQEALPGKQRARWKMEGPQECESCWRVRQGLDPGTPDQDTAYVIRQVEEVT